MTLVAGLTLMITGISEFVFEKKKWKWYHYIPQAAINTVLGIVSPRVLIYMLENADQNKSWVLGILYLCGILLNNIVFFVIFVRNEHFSGKFYWTVAITCLCVMSFWMMEWQWF